MFESLYCRLFYKYLLADKPHLQLLNRYNSLDTLIFLLLSH